MSRNKDNTTTSASESDYELFICRSLVEEDEDEDEAGLFSSNIDDEKDDEGLSRSAGRAGSPAVSASLRERLQRATRNCIAANRLRKVLDASNTCAAPEPAKIDDTERKVDLLSRLSTEHPRNAGRYTVLAFVNANSGGGKGRQIFNDLTSHLGKQYVFNLGQCSAGNMPEDLLMPYAADPYVRVLCCGGDGTVGWISSSIDKVYSRLLPPGTALQYTEYSNHLPLAIMPLGTGNDLARQFGWGGKFKDKMRKEQMIVKVTMADIAYLDRWRIVVLPLTRLDDEARKWVPRMLGEKLGDKKDAIPKLEQLFTVEDSNSGTFNAEAIAADQDEEIEVVPSTQFFDGVFCNYFSIGMDANVAFQFHQEREEHPERFTSPLVNKIVYLQKAPATALWAPLLHDKIRIMVRQSGGDDDNNEDKIEEVKVPKYCRAVVLLNIQSYAGGNKLSSEGKSDDGFIEVIFISNLTRAATSSAMGPMFKSALFRVAAQTRMVWIRTKEALHCQVDGEPWLQGEAVIKVSHNSRNALLRKAKKPSAFSCSCADSNESVVVAEM